jgi:hypothetical protein
MHRHKDAETAHRAGAPADTSGRSRGSRRDAAVAYAQPGRHHSRQMNRMSRPCAGMGTMSMAYKP